jgi:hypothetical protein
MENNLDAINIQLKLLKSLSNKYKSKKEKDEIRREIKFFRNKKYRLEKSISIAKQSELK